MSSLVINRQSVNLQGQPADLMLLELLRETRRLCGTKEGCGSGDCGACTVVLAPSQSGQSIDSALDPGGDNRYQAINACITFAQSLDGLQITTVDDPSPDDTLTSVREAMVEHHASQCGFCTPGFVMSAYALVQNAKLGLEKPSDDGDWTEAIERYLGGNLCRCTGYRPIVDACQSVLSRLNQLKAPSQRPVINDTSASPHLRQSRSQAPVFFRPRDLDELNQYIETYPEARLLAGGTDLALEVTQGLQSLKQIIWLGEVAEMQEISFVGSWCTLGAGISLRQLDETLCEQFPDLSSLLHRFGSEQIRGSGTLGGNLGTASPIGDLPPVLLALDAIVLLGGPSGRREVPLSEFFLDYRVTARQKGEYIVSVRLPDIDNFRDPKSSVFLKVYKISKRMDDDISSVCAAYSGQLVDGRLSNVRSAFGGVAAKPVRLKAVEEALNGRSLHGAEGDQTIEEAQAVLDRELNPISDARASEWYRRLVSANLLKRLRVDLVEDTSITRIGDYV